MLKILGSENVSVFSIKSGNSSVASIFSTNIKTKKLNKLEITTLPRSIRQWGSHAIKPGDAGSLPKAETMHANMNLVHFRSTDKPRNGMRIKGFSCSKIIRILLPTVLQNLSHIHQVEA